MRPYVLITGERGGAKTRLAAEIAAEIAAAGWRVGGFLQDRVELPEEGKAYDLVRLGSGERVRLGQKAPQARRGESHFCEFAFRDGAFAEARAWLEADLPRDVVFVDEVSKLEAAGQGHAASVRLALASDALVVLCVRAEALFIVMERFGLEDEPLALIELSFGTGSREELVAAIQGHLARR